MRKLHWFLIFALLLTALLSYSASAEMLTVETDLQDDAAYTYMLRSGDTLHCLTISSHPHPAKDLSEITVSIAAQCSALTGDVLVPCQDHCADRFQDRTFQNASTEVIPTRGIFGMAVSPQNRTYLIDGDWAVYQWTPEAEEPWRYLCTLDTSILDFDNFVTNQSFSAEGDTLFACFLERAEDDEAQPGTAFSYSLTSGAGEKLFTMPSMRSVYPVDENRMLFEGKPDASMRFIGHYLYDFTSQKTTVFRNDAISKLVPDGLGGWYGVAPSGYNANGIYHYDEDGVKSDMLAMLPGDLQEISLSLGGEPTTVYVCGWNGCLGIYPLTSADEKAASTLVLAGSLHEYGHTNTLPDIAEFSAAYGGASITSVDYPSSFDDLALELVSGSDRFDLMVLELSMGNVDSLLSKGYYVDLSDSDGIAAYVENLYPTWRDACLRGDEIVGIPITARSIWMFMVNLEVWEEEGLGEIPKTYDELFDCIREWDDMGVLDEVPLFHNRHSSSFDWLHNRIMLDYMGKCKREGKPIVFTDETLLHLLTRLEEARPILDAHDARNITGDGLIFEGALSNIIRITSFMGFEVSAENNVYTPLPLGLTDESDCVEAVFLTLLVVNPNSKRQELAKAYLAYIAEHPTTWARCYLLKDGPVGVREAGYEDLDEQYEQLLSELNEKIMAAMKEGDDAVVNRWEQEKKALTDDYLNRWEVRPSIAEMLYRLRPYFTPLTSDGYGFLMNSCADLTKMFLEGQMDSRTYTMRLDERKQIAEMEGNH